MSVASVRLPEGTARSLEKNISSKALVSAHDVGTLKAYVDFACTVEGGLALIGWVFDPENQIRGFVRVYEPASGKSSKGVYAASDIRNEVGRSSVSRLPRLDVAEAMSDSPTRSEQDHGFVLILNDFSAREQVALELDDGRLVLLQFSATADISAIEAALPAFWPHSGDALLMGLHQSLGATHGLTMLADGLECPHKNVERKHRFSACDHAYLLNGKVLVLNGWIAETTEEIRKVELLVNGTTVDVTRYLVRYFRPDLHAAYPWADDHALGFLCLVRLGAMPTSEIRIKVIGANGRTQILRASVQKADWPRLAEMIRVSHAVAEPLLRLLDGAGALDDSVEYDKLKLERLRREHFLAVYPNLPTHIERHKDVIAAIDHAYPLGMAGLLIFGWMFTPGRPPKAITVKSKGKSVAISDKITHLPRADVAQHYKQRYAGMNEWCGFVTLVPMPTRAGDRRVLSFDFGEMGHVELKIPTPKPERDGIALVKEILGMIPAPDRLRHKLCEMFDKGLGQALEAINTQRPAFKANLDVRQFGEAPAEPDVSVIVPLYGRFDFVRHQLAQFCDDQDFQHTDLIYVVDDPGILSQTIELAARYQPLFKVPFRIVSYGENRGFAGANNVGASVARGDYLVLLNSDVIPQHTGWLTSLKSALDTLPDAGAVGPLLQFGDGAVQHAGMHPRTDPALPGFLLNTHPGMGMAWEGSDSPSEHPMLTAACLMLRRADYDGLGGLDEGYIVGDFEDSDLCLALRKQGKRLWLVPAARLWHLERQSQTLGDAVGHRQMITLFNGWRFKEKVRKAILADPMSVEVQQ